MLIDEGAERSGTTKHTGILALLIYYFPRRSFLEKTQKRLWWWDAPSLRNTSCRLLGIGHFSDLCFVVKMGKLP